MGRFYAGAPMFGWGPDGRSASVAPGAVRVQRSPVGPGSVLPAEPDRPFGPFMIRPPFIGAPIAKPIIPPYADQQTINSLAPPTSAVPFGRFGVVLTRPLPGAPSAAPPAKSAAPVPPPAPVHPIFIGVAQAKIARAANDVVTAQRATSAANKAQQVAAQTAHQASKAQAQAAVNPHPAVQQAARAATAQANHAATTARTLSVTAELQNIRAVKALDQAQRSPLTNSGYQNAHDSGSVDPNLAHDLSTASGGGDGSSSGGDSGGGDSYAPPPDAYSPPDLFAQSGATPNAGLVANHPYMTAAGAAGVGFLLGGPVGALIGLLGGGTYAYRQVKASEALPLPSTVNLPMAPATLPISWEFTPYQMPDGTPINSPQDEQAYYAAHQPPAVNGW